MREKLVELKKKNPEVNPPKPTLAERSSVVRTSQMWSHSALLVPAPELCWEWGMGWEFPLS